MSAADSAASDDSARLDLDTSGSVSRIVLAGRLDSAGVDALEIRFNAATVASGKAAIVDLSGVSFLASLGIRMLLTATKRMAASGRPLVLHGARGLVDEALRSMDLYRLIPHAANEQEALDLAEA
ncbi:MAG: STAS domain-containing protein [Acidobacteriota bacterium]